MKNPGGRPLKFKTPEELQEKIDEYLGQCKILERCPTIAGLARALEVDRQTIYNYEKKDEFFDIIKRGRDYILAELEDKLVNENNVGGAIFIAKNYGYTDRITTENNNTYNIKDIDKLKEIFSED